MSLSSDNFFEIFSKLPAKDIYRLMSTCKILSKFPKESNFAFKQAQHALLRDDTCFLIQPEIPIEATKWCNLPVEFHPLPGEELSSGMSKNVLAFFSKGVKILCSTNGLALCSMFSENEVKFFIINPATHSWSPIPTHDHLQNSSFYDHKIGFLCDSDGNFMIYHFIDDLVDWSSYFECNVYKEGMWKAKERFFSGSRSLRFDMPVYHKGAIHFISDCSPYLTRNNPYFRPYIMSYNFEDGKSRMLRIPKEARRGSHDRSCSTDKGNSGLVESFGTNDCSNSQNQNLTSSEVSKPDEVKREQLGLCDGGEKGGTVRGAVRASCNGGISVRVPYATSSRCEKPCLMATSGRRRAGLRLRCGGLRSQTVFAVTGLRLRKFGFRFGGGSLGFLLIHVGRFLSRGGAGGGCTSGATMRGSRELRSAQLVGVMVAPATSGHVWSVWTGFGLQARV
ncbi:hypothetical protein V8G54_016029 [Vigna mungo]|uniref:F-box protein n=1 Tax=Vigna mungo TaxID=3915 RepID=A0AAQ3RXE8_VIGMU